MIRNVVIRKKITVKVEKFKKVVIWDCGMSHQHITEKAAENCIAKTDAQAKRAEREQVRRTNALIVVEMALKGSGWKEIGGKIGISPSTASSMFERVRRLVWLYCDREDGYIHSMQKVPFHKQNQTVKDLFFKRAQQVIHRY